jgi:hypothetical protein
MVVIGLFIPFGTMKATSTVFPITFPISDDQMDNTGGINIWGIIIASIIFPGLRFIRCVFRR